jgi:predicted DNA-binding transcriptional regulator AlpA
MAGEKQEYGPFALLTQRDLARLFCVSTSTIQRMRSEPRFPVKKAFGGGVSGWLFRDILAYIEQAPPVGREDTEE